MVKLAPFLDERGSKSHSHTNYTAPLSQCPNFLPVIISSSKSSTLWSTWGLEKALQMLYILVQRLMKQRDKFICTLWLPPSIQWKNALKSTLILKARMGGIQNPLDIKNLEMQLRICGQVPWHWEKIMFPDLASILLLGQAPLFNVHSSTFQKHLLIPSLPLAFLKRSGEDIPNWLSVLRRMGSQKPVRILTTSVPLRLGWWGHFCLYNTPKHFCGLSKNLICIYST